MWIILPSYGEFRFHKVVKKERKKWHFQKKLIGRKVENDKKTRYVENLNWRLMQNLEFKNKRKHLANSKSHLSQKLDLRKEKK